MRDMKSLVNSKLQMGEMILLEKIFPENIFRSSYVPYYKKVIIINFNPSYSFLHDLHFASRFDNAVLSANARNGCKVMELLERAKSSRNTVV